MPRAKPLRSYPNAEYGALWARVARTREDVVLPMDRSRAMSLRAEFYGWARQARAAHAPDVMALGIDLGSLDDVRMTIAPDGLKLYHKENAVGVAEIRALLGPGFERPVAPEVLAVTDTPLSEQGEDYFMKILATQHEKLKEKKQ